MTGAGILCGISPLSSYWNSLEESVPVDKIYYHPIFKWAAVTWLSDSAPEGRLNKKDGLTRYGNSHVKDKTS